MKFNKSMLPWIGLVLLFVLVVWLWPMPPIVGGRDCRKIVGRLVVCAAIEMPGEQAAQQQTQTPQSAPAAKK